MINSSAGVQPHCLSAEFAFRQTSHYYMCFFTLLQKHGKNFFRKLIFAAKSFYEGKCEKIRRAQMVKRFEDLTFTDD